MKEKLLGVPLPPPSPPIRTQIREKRCLHQDIVLVGWLVDQLLQWMNSNELK